MAAPVAMVVRRESTNIEAVQMETRQRVKRVLDRRQPLRRRLRRLMA